VEDDAIADYISPIAAIFSAVVTLIATVAAFRAASAAKTAVENAARAERRATLRELLATQRSVQIEAANIETIADQLKSEARAMFVIAGAPGGSAEAQFIAGIDEFVQHRIANSRGNADRIERDYAKLSKASPDDIVISLSDLEGCLITLRAAHDHLLRQLSDVRARSAELRAQQAAR
jgi:hypothetical protein